MTTGRTKRCCMCLTKPATRWSGWLRGPGRRKTSAGFCATCNRKVGLGFRGLYLGGMGLREEPKGEGEK
jgi:hypothetical protein